MFMLFLGMVIGFVVGVLFGRRNTKKVEAALEEIKQKYEELKNKS